MKKKALRAELQKRIAHNQALKLELTLCKLGLTPEMQKRFLETALKQHRYAKKQASKQAAKQKKGKRTK